jgi:hypothetical protein
LWSTLSAANWTNVPGMKPCLSVLWAMLLTHKEYDGWTDAQMDGWPDGRSSFL